MTLLRTLHLYGDLAREYGKTHKIVSTASFHDAIRIVDCNQPGFLRRVLRGQWHCLRGDKTLKRSLEMQPEHVTLPIQGDLHLVPAVSGGKSRGMKIIFSIVVGGALLATGIGGALGAFGGAVGLGAHIGFMGLTYGTIALMGAGILLGGLSMLLTPVPKTKDNQKDTWTFDGPVNVSEEGTAIPLAYGDIIVGGITIASSIVNGNGNGNNLASSGNYTLNNISGGGYTTAGGFKAHDFSNYV